MSDAKKYTEYEIKILGVDIGKLKQALSKHNFKQTPRYLFKRRVYDLQDGGWLRLRTDGKTTTLTYKKFHFDSIDGVEEIEITVSDFEDTNKILEKSGLVIRNYQENYRTEFTNSEIEISIDEWPLIKPYVEIEGKSVRIVEKYLELLNLNKHKTTSKPTSYVYELAKIDILAIKKLKF